MYCNNPLIEIYWPCESDPVAQSLHDDNHCLFYNSAVNKNNVKTTQRLSDLCNWINNKISQQKIDNFLIDQNNRYEIANFVKLNMWVYSLSIIGNVKPMLLYYTGGATFQTGTGQSRLRALERIPSIQTVTSFITTHKKYANQFDHLESITTLDRFAELCDAEPGQMFLFRLTDDQAPYGLDWYEVNSQKTAKITPGEEYCVEVFSNYIKQHSTVVFTPEWFDALINWDSYKN